MCINDIKMLKVKVWDTVEVASSRQECAVDEREGLTFPIFYVPAVVCRSH